MWHMQKNPSVVLPLAALRITKWKRKSTNVSIYSIQTNKLFILGSLGVPIKTAGNTVIALQGMVKYCLNVFVAYSWKWNILHFCGIMACLNKWSFVVVHNINSHGNYLQDGTIFQNWFETDLSVLTMNFWDTRKKNMHRLRWNFPPTSIEVIK